MRLLMPIARASPLSPLAGREPERGVPLIVELLPRRILFHPPRVPISLFTIPNSLFPAQPLAEASHQAGLIAFGQFMFPDSQHAPSPRPQRAIDPLIPGNIPAQFPVPEPAVMAGPGAMLWAAVPETAVHKNRHPLRAKREIRLSKQSGMASPAEDAMPPQNLRQRPLRLLVPGRSNAPHHLRPLRFGEYVRHKELLLQHRWLTTARRKKGTKWRGGEKRLSVQKQFS